MPHRDLAAWLALLERRHPSAIDLGLDRCGRVWQRLDAPRPGHRVITVAGTNGKGSAVAWMHALLAALGHSTAAYTSPHLLRFNERLAFDGQAVDDDPLVDAFEAVEQARGEESLTYFEFTTLACLLLMERRRPDFALLEVGLGGRLDTVNLVDADLAVIMPVGLDHQQYLGQDRESIGAEKAGILRPGQPLVCGEAQPPASVLARAAELDCAVYLPGRDFHLENGGDALRFRMGDVRLSLPLPPLAGPHQPGNLAAALAAVLLACPWAEAEAGALREGVRSARLPGRLQTIGSQPAVLLDVGHNPLAAAAVAAHLDALGGPACHCVLAMLRDKDAESVARILDPHVAAWHCASLGGARGQEARQLASRLRQALPQASVCTHGPVAAALAAARAAAGPDGLVLVFGSFETAAASLRECC